MSNLDHMIGMLIGLGILTLFWIVCCLIYPKNEDEGTSKLRFIAYQEGIRKNEEDNNG